MSSRPFPLERKSTAIKWALAHPDFAGWPKKDVLAFAVRNWKARKGNLNGRPHPSEHVSWKGWLSITAKRRHNHLARAGMLAACCCDGCCAKRRGVAR